MTSSFIYATCKEGAHIALKDELKQKFPQCSPAFMQPQLLSFKSQYPLRLEDCPKLIFAQRTGLSLGIVKTLEEIPELLLKHQLFQAQLFCLPVSLPEEVTQTGESVHLYEMAQKIRDLAAVVKITLFEPDVIHYPMPLLEVICLEKDQGYFIGLLNATTWQLKCPAGIFLQQLPAEPISRAWLKMNQALHWFLHRDPHFCDHSSILELGAAPGGSVLALLKHFKNIYAVDTAQISAQLESAIESGQVHVYTQTLQEIVHLRSLPSIPIISCDINLRPNQILPHLIHLIDLQKPRYLHWTFKLNTEKPLSQIHPILSALKSAFPQIKLHCEQWHIHHQEAALLARFEWS
jgi:23S rRNA C2498 (ribose-2'-O)-methylase RlmM